LTQDRALKRRIRSASRKGLLNTAKLKPNDKALVHSAIQAMPSYLYENTDSVLWIVDTGCTDTSTGFKEDFKPGSLKVMDPPMLMDGVGGQLWATHKGTVSFEVLADNGTIHVVETDGLLVPTLACRLMSPQAYLIEQKKQGNTQSRLVMDHNGTALEFNNNTKATMPHDACTRLPKLRAYHDTMKTAESIALVCITDERNQNLSSRAKSLLRWHFKLGHLGFQRLQWIGRQGWLGKAGEYFGLSSVQAPKCAACQFGKQERLKTAGKTASVDTEREMILKQDKVLPGDLVFGD
jgi:hypothetical protein